jgi:hypothetical protein
MIRQADGDGMKVGLLKLKGTFYLWFQAIFYELQL